MLHSILDQGPYLPYLHSHAVKILHKKFQIAI